MPSPSSAFRELHGGAQILCLPNAWDVATARLFESLGAPAIATTSAGVAWSLGYGDGHKMPAGELVDLVARMLRVIRAPLSVDVEDGYSDDPAKVADLVQRLAGMGVAGINIEDGTAPALGLERKLSAIRTALERGGIDLFVNARTDVFLAQLVEAPRRVSETLERARRYVAVGADGVFVPGLVQAAEIQAIASAVAQPLNVMAWPGLPDAQALRRLGVKRLSSGSGIAQALLGHAGRLAQGFLANGRSEDLGDPIPFSRMQALFADAT